MVIRRDSYREVSKCAYFFIQPSSNFICLMFSPICLLNRLIQEFVQKALFSEIQRYRQLEVGGVTTYDNG